jgi:hypothetical protein
MITFGKLLFAFIVASFLTALLTMMAIIPTQCEIEKVTPMRQEASAYIAYNLVMNNAFNVILSTLFLTFATTAIYNTISM